MQISVAERLRKNYGDRPCEHKSFEKEYYLGADTGDFICRTCGSAFTRDEMMKIEEAHRRKKN